MLFCLQGLDSEKRPLSAEGGENPKGDSEVWEGAGCGRKACVGQGSEAASIERKEDSAMLTHMVTSGGTADEKMLGTGPHVITAILLADCSMAKSEAQAPALRVWV